MATVAGHCLFYDNLIIGWSFTKFTFYVDQKSNPRTQLQLPRWCNASMLNFIVVDHGLIPLSAQIKNYKIDIYCFSSKYIAWRGKSKDGFGWSRDNVSRGAKCLPVDCCFSELTLLKSNSSVLVLYKADTIIFSSKSNLFSPWYSWKVAHLVLNDTHFTINTFYVNCKSER